MRQIKQTATAVILIASAGNVAVGEKIIGTTDVYLGGGVDAVFDTLSDVSLGMLVNGDAAIENQIFFADHLSISGEDIGTTWVSDAAMTGLIREQFLDADTDDAFGAYSLFTNSIGTQEFFAGVQEWQFDFQFPPLDIELLATQTDEIRVTLVSFTADSPGFDPNGDGVWTDYLAVFRYEFVSVPAPTSTAVLLGGALCLLRRRRA